MRDVIPISSTLLVTRFESRRSETYVLW